MMKPTVIGITGGIGSGKTAATDFFQKLNIDVVDADVVARDIVAAGSPVLEQIVSHFGESVLLPNGELNRAGLRTIIFSNPEEKKALNHIMHPAIREQILQQLRDATSAYVLLSAPLLFENGLEKLTDGVIVVDVDETTQIARASGRDSVEQSQIEAIMASQMSRQTRRDRADYVIDNSASLAFLEAQVKKAHLWALTVQ